jgi:hypothetical protein
VSDPAGHRYLSTACLHGLHGYCQASAREGKLADGGRVLVEKRPASCKFCGMD